MTQRPFSNADPFLQCIVLFLLSFVGIAVFLFMAHGLINAIWGVSFFSNPESIQDYTNPEVIQINRVLLMFQHLGMFVVPAIAFAVLISTRWKQYLGFLPAKPVFIIASIGIMLVALPSINALAWLNLQLKLPEFLSGLEKMLGGMEDNAAELTRAITRTENLPLFLFNIFVVALLPAMGEEMIFRGALMPIIIKWTGKKHTGVWVSAALFSAMHMQFYGFIPRMMLGALLGYLFLWSRSLWAPIAAHFTNNALAVFLLFLMSRGKISEELDSFEPPGFDFLWLLISLGLIAGILYLVYKRRNREVLPSLETNEDESDIELDDLKEENY